MIAKETRRRLRAKRKWMVALLCLLLAVGIGLSPVLVPRIGRALGWAIWTWGRTSVRGMGVERVATADEVIDTYRANAIGGDRMYKDQVISIKGTVSSVGYLGGGKAAYINFSRMDSIDKVQVQFHPIESDSLAWVREGDVITVLGLGAGYREGIAYFVLGLYDRTPR